MWTITVYYEDGTFVRDRLSRINALDDAHKQAEAFRQFNEDVDNIERDAVKAALRFNGRDVRTWIRLGDDHVRA